MNYTKISFCFTHLNRLNFPHEGESLPLFKNCLSSLINCLDTLPGLEYEIVISSFDTEEIYTQLNDFVYSVFPSSNVTITHHPIEDFTRGGGRQIAYENSTGNIIAFIDADMLFMRPYVIQKGLEITNRGHAYFPICFTMFSTGDGKWRPTGKGNCFIPKRILKNIQWLSKKTWGQEDDKFMDDLDAVTLIYRDNTPGWYHQYHPSPVIA
ncbi:MAG TPA: hypothetical protein DCM40_41145 [Maribacter sp.]|nr:hypothetical protein [Maribacter sp.]